MGHTKIGHGPDVAHGTWLANPCTRVTVYWRKGKTQAF